MISCCTMCVHFPDGLSSLLPDLVCVVLHRPVICVSSRSALCRCIHLYISHRSALSLSHLVFYVLSALLLGAIGLFVEGPTGLCVKAAHLFQHFYAQKCLYLSPFIYLYKLCM